jgi:hypothetical protein
MDNNAPDDDGTRDRDVLDPLGVDAYQRELAARVRSRLRVANAAFDEDVITHHEARVTEFLFRLHVRERTRLTAEVNIGPELFQFEANAAQLRLYSQDVRDDLDRWVQLSDETFKALVTHDLRIRLRRTLFGRWHGAVWVPGQPGAWNGELFATLGWGREERFENWLATSPP